MEMAMIVSEDEPTLTEALNGNKCSEWYDVVDAELSQMEKVDTWIPVVPLPDANIILSHYVFCHKHDAAGNVASYKAQLIIKGFRQQFGVDYIETFAPTVWASTLQILLSFAAQKNAAVHQCDIKNAYLNSHLQDGIELYSELPPKYENFCSLPLELKGKPNVVCKWLVTVYGSKQGAHDWYAEVKSFFLNLRYSVSTVDEVMFYLYHGDTFIIVAATTDDFTVIANSTENTNNLIQKQLTMHFEISDLGPINWLLGISIMCNLEDKTISLSQQAYVEQIISRFDLQNAWTTITPMEPRIDLSFDSPTVSLTLLTPTKKTKYREMISSLMYAAIMTCPDIAFTISTLSQYLDTPRTTHLIAVTRVFRYLSGTKGLKLVLGGNDSDITRYSDADCHSISGFAYFIGAGVINWSSKKQPIITLSSTKAKYVALTHASKDILWIHKLLTKLSSIFSFTLPTTLFCDNQGTIQLSKDSDIHFHFICQSITSGHITMQYCPTDDMIANIFTKSLSHVKYKNFHTLLRVI